MALDPIGSNAQEAPPLTLALKSICQDYPAGGIVLRELLQNADDAGATCVRFVLDEKTHPMDSLIHEQLQQYQGPALLAYNNAEFTDNDFQNLKQLNNSQKLYDGTKTGRFGRGFNSVYNWTDSPSIVSRDRILFLDPHKEWSLGGNLYDFVETSGDEIMKNHMAAFQDVIKYPKQRLNGTVIRIPLRTAAQAIKSQISTRETTVPDLKKVLQSFASEFKDNGLLFMKSVEKLEITANEISISIEIIDGDAVRSHKLKVNEDVKRALKDPATSIKDKCFEIGIEYKGSGLVRTTRYMVQHIIKSDSIDGDLLKWAANEKLIPWVAVAAQLSTNPAHSFRGSLFTVLPLPIFHSQPVHIHGLFSISPDRARLYQLSDLSVQDKTQARWNDFLLQGPVPVAWAKLLANLANSNSRHSLSHRTAFQNWPKRTTDTRDILSNALPNVLSLIGKESLVVWPTKAGYVAAEDGLITVNGGPIIGLREAILETEVPVIYCLEEIEQQAKSLFDDRALCPQSLCSFLKRDSQGIRQWSDRTKIIILEYILSDPNFTAYGELEIFPFEDGTYQAIEEGICFLHRNELEKDLFRFRKSQNLDLDKLSAATQRALKLGCETPRVHRSIRYRSARCLKNYCMNTIFKDVPQHQDMIELNPESVSIVEKAWEWILLRDITILNDEISCLWLLPLSNGCYRRIKLQAPSSPAYLPPPGELGRLMWKFNELSKRVLPLISSVPTGEKPPWITLLTRDSTHMSQLSIENASDMVVFLDWLYQTSSLDYDVSDEDKLMIVRLLADHSKLEYDTLKRVELIKSLGRLKVFRRISWGMVDNKMVKTLSWTNLNICKNSIGLLDSITTIVPQIDDTQFLVAESSSPTKELLLNLGIAKCLGSVQIIQDCIIPAWKRGEAENWNSCLKERIAAFILGNFSLLTPHIQAKLKTLPFVPVAQLDGTNTSRFGLAADLIDAKFYELKDLYFQDECIVPKQIFIRSFSAILIACDLKTAVDEAVVSSRVRCYAESTYLLSDRISFAERLLRSTCRWTSPVNKRLELIIRKLAWIPAADKDGVQSLYSSHQCRSFRDRLLVSSQLPTLQFPISTEWEERLGWGNQLSDNVLLLQLAFGIDKKDRSIIDSVLNYIEQKGLSDPLAVQLKSLSCVVINCGVLVKPSLAFRPCEPPFLGCERLQPYLGNVEHSFWKEHNKLLSRLEIRDQPHIDDLLEVQKTLEGKSTLDEPDTNVAVEILNHAARFPRATLNNLKVISEAGKFESLENICFDDHSPQKTKQQVTLTHPDILPSTIQKLGIIGLRERLVINMLDIENLEDEDEFDQREDVVTRIRDTLARYPVEATFREYLANADDAKGATKISWRLDLRNHSCEKLLMPEMAILQGPALLVYNDGIFCENDFKGFKSVGEGSKAQDKEAIGQFGRGSQTMYHWTDTPMILSGKYLVILDPQRRILPKKQSTGTPMPGVKMLLSKLRDTCPGQLSPFEGLWDYTLSSDIYPGTIFRFPLRTSSIESRLILKATELKTSAIYELMHNYFDEARVSLLFLRKIRSIDFCDHEGSGNKWSVFREQPLDEDVKMPFSGNVICSISKNTNFSPSSVCKDKWRVVMKALDVVPDHTNGSLTRQMKSMQCGLAALLSSTIDNNTSEIASSKLIKPRLFNILPLPINSDLPVHIHATFSLSGDRQSISIDEYGAKCHASLNRYLLQSPLPELYLQFLEEIGKDVGEDVYKYWPQEKSPDESVSQLLCASFWNKVPQSSQQLFPRSQLIEGCFKRQAAELLTISDAVFDILPGIESKILLPLLMSLDVPLVRKVPVEVAKHLKELSNVKTLSGSRLRNLFKSKQSGSCLKKQMNGSPSTFEVLVRLLIPEDGNLEDLDGCYILPLADGNIGQLTWHDRGESKASNYYYLAGQKHLELFKFASRHLVNSKFVKRLVPVFDKGNFNLEKLRLCHVKKLLVLRSQVPIPDPEVDRWLIEFWQFWNEDVDSSLPSSNVDSFAFKIFKAKCNGEYTYASPIEFHKFTAVIAPSISEHQQICEIIPDLYVFDPKFMPQTLAGRESSFNKAVSFLRLIRALKVLASQDGMSNFINSHLASSHIKVLRNLTTIHISDGILDDESENFPGFCEDLKTIPMWPSFHSDGNRQALSANSAFMASKEKLLVPWMKECHRFIDPLFLKRPQNENCLLKLGVTKVSVHDLLERHILPLPSTLGDDWEHFVALIGTLSNMVQQQELPMSTLSLLSESRIAADGNCTLMKAQKLFDHNDQMFLQAFRREKRTRFLHSALIGMRSFWLRNGLRHQKYGVIAAADYLECIHAMGVRMHAKDLDADPHLEQDCRTVLLPLTAPDVRTPEFSGADWEEIVRERVFLSKTVFSAEPEYRRNCMAVVASKRRLLCCSDIISNDYVGVCWSQTPFSAHEPKRGVLNRVSNKGRPNVSIVWQHLLRMKVLSEDLESHHVRDFLADLRDTYEYLQDSFKNGSVTYISKDEEVWLNLDSLDDRGLTLTDIKSSWCSINNLVLSSSCDAESMKAVRSGLMHYEQLLKSLHCAFIVYPKFERPQLHDGYSITQSLQQLRREDKMLDVAYSSEGKLVYAHRVVLAAASEKCAAQFTGPWKVEDVIKYDKGDDIVNFLSYHALCTMIDYAYGNEINWEEMEVSENDDIDIRAEKLDKLLDLLKGADCWLMHELRSQVQDKILLAGNLFMTVTNIVEFWERANEIGASSIENMCMGFIDKNSKILKKVHGEEEIMEIMILGSRAPNG